MTAVAVTMAIVWVTFVASSFSSFVAAQATGSRNVYVNGIYIGNVELYPLVNNRTLNVYFHPVNNDLNIINQFHLNWWQVANRSAVPGYPRQDVQNQGFNLPGNPGDDNDPSYYTNNERSGNGVTNGFAPNIIFAGNNWWMQDSPGVGNGITFETWLVSQNANIVERLVCFNWGVLGNGGTQTNTQHPNFINSSSYNVPQTLNNSGFGNYWQEFPQGPTAVQVSLAGIDAGPDHVRLTWFSPDATTLRASVYRRTVDTDWQQLGPALLAGSNRLGYEDRSVTPGTRYAYRLGWQDQGQTTYAAESWVETPAVAQFALQGLRPNPAAGPLNVAFSLPNASHATLEMVDVSGRRLFEQEVGSLGAGMHVVRLDRTGVSAGVYWLKLTQAGRTQTTRGVVVR